MMVEPTYLSPPGEAVNQKDLRSVRGRAFHEYLRRCDQGSFATLLEVRRTSTADVVVFDIQPERPQEIVHNIKRVERIAISFPDNDAWYPEVVALRNDFPLVPHVNRGDKEFPRSLCLFDQAWNEEKLSWTPVRFLQRIQTWLSKTATGSLHAGDQPLEPLILIPCSVLVVPADFKTRIRKEPAIKLRVQDCLRTNNKFTIVMDWDARKLNKPAEWLCATFEAPHHTHGVISRTPHNLKELHELCAVVGLPILEQLRDKISAWLQDPETKGFLEAKVILTLLLPKTRTKGGDLEWVETVAFYTLKTTKELGAALGICDWKADVVGGAAGLLINAPAPNPDDFAQIEILAMTVKPFLDPSTAADMNGVESDLKRALAIGVGAFGSQILNNFIRAGIGQWTLVDSDTLEPHNLARHLLPAHCVGRGKAEALSDHLKYCLSTVPALVEPLAVDVLSPGKHADVLKKEKEQADFVFDFSASVAVARQLSIDPDVKRAVSTFVTPSGNGMVMLIEDQNRQFRLDWLEALHYRAILATPVLRDSLKTTEGRIRTGGSCRDLSVVISQSDMAMWAGAFTKQSLPLLSKPQAALKILQQKGDGGVDAFTVNPEHTQNLCLGDWTVLIDTWIMRKMKEFRRERLPNETGGILLGMIDTQTRRCYVVDVLPSPPDSIEYPDSYIRGCSELLPKVQEAEELTAGHVTYIGEWHSHPEKCSTSASSLDLIAYAKLKADRDAECLPTIMMIIGDPLLPKLIRPKKQKE
jgi:hypothetical protein